MPSARVPLRKENVGSTGEMEFTVDILTGGRAAPMVTLGDNAGFPDVKDFYARAVRVSASGGSYDVVSLTIRFHDAISASAREIAVNVFQEDATEFVFPWFSLIRNEAFAGEPRKEKVVDDPAPKKRKRNRN